MKPLKSNIKDERARAYRYVWGIVYRMARDSKTPRGDKVPFVGMAEVVAIFVRHYEANDTDLRDMLTRATDIIYYQPDPFPTLSEMRRVELDDIANGIVRDICDGDIPF